ncbi:hypothetical protein [Paeniglutamicibacter antarcticus]|uniref:5,10-methylene-tetrahydrofolate dehydrogenase n=1 Tax=Paeniglutamicibacter antarcticus TaxID=494023 RepID=A0ABP9TFV8_9MICC
MPAESRRTIVVGVIADEGLPYSVALGLKDSLTAVLGRDLDSEADWDLRVSEFSLPLDEQGDVDIISHSLELRQSGNWDYMVYLTDLPKYVNGEPMTSSINAGHASAVVVLPSLGIVRRKRLVRAMEQVLAKLHGVQDPFLTEDGRASVILDPFSVERRVEAADVNENAFETVKGIRGRLLLLGGLIRSNRPWRLIPGLSSALAAALAAGAFGVFYTSIWSMADYLPMRRLVIISILSVVIMGSWLVLHNRLWERPRGSRHREKRVLYNLATTGTVLMAVVLMYLALFAIILAGALIIIDPKFLAMQLEGEVGFGEYVNLSWLSASLGIVAGAVGSSFDDEDSVRKATFSSREFERRQITMDYDSEDDG